MGVAIAGGHGKIAFLLSRLLPATRRSASLQGGARNADDFDAEQAELPVDDADGDRVFQVYLRAKSEADAAVRARDLDWTIVRPGGLTDAPGSGRVAIAEKLSHGSVPRADVAAVIAELLRTGRGVRRQVELTSGPTPFAAAVASLG